MPVHKGPECVGEEMRRFHKGEMHSGKSGKVVTNPAQGKAIALSACGKSKYAETLKSIGYSEETANEIVSLFSESFLKSSKSSSSVSSFEEIDWKANFETGKGPGPENPDNYHTGMLKKKGRGQLRIGKGPGTLGKAKDAESEMLSGPALEKGPGNPQGGSSKGVQGMRMLG